MLIVYYNTNTNCIYYNIKKNNCYDQTSIIYNIYIYKSSTNRIMLKKMLSMNVDGHILLLLVSLDNSKNLLIRHFIFLALEVYSSYI